MLNDAHIHVGQFREIYTTPQELVEFLDSVGVDRFAVSSTTIWEENYEKVLSEIHELLLLAPHRVVPVLWITPSMLENGGLKLFLDSDIVWRCVKVHGVHPWTDEGIQQCIEVARHLHVPLLFHTGGFEQCEAGVYLPVVMQNPDVTFILAHARPIEQTIEVMQQCPNAWADTAFTPIECIRQLMDAGFEDRVLFGTDTPLQRIYVPTLSWEDAYIQNANQIRGVITNEQWRKISNMNSRYLFQLY